MKLQKPEFAYMGGKLRPWDEATLHVGCEAAIRGLNVFEGLKGYRQPDGSLAIVMLRRHYERLRRSARLLHIPCDPDYDEFTRAVRELSEALQQPGKEMWFRPTLFVTEGHWGENTAADLVVTAYQTDPSPPQPINLGVSTWRRSPDVSMPARIKTGTNYQVARLARIEGRMTGCQDMVLLNESGRVAEATGSCILMVRAGTVYTPPAIEGALESITVDIVEALAHSLRIRFIRRPIDRTELLVADELALCGTLAEVVRVKSIEGLPLSEESPILHALQTRYFQAVRGIHPHPFIEVTNVCLSETSSKKEVTVNSVGPLACPVCESRQTHLFFSQHGVPAQVGYLAPTHAQALECVLGDITLQHCRSCAHVWNSSFDPGKLGFDPNYDFSQYYSPAYRDYIAGSIERLKSRYNLTGKTALDIGCGKGDYLRMLVRAGIAKAIGFDPTFVETNFADEDRKRITVYRKYYGRDDRGLKPDLVTCRSALQYIPKPREFLSSLRETLDGQFGTVVYFEVPNGAEAFRERRVWYVMYEAGCFFSTASLARIFRECGFQVLDVLPALGASQLEMEARLSRSPGVPHWEDRELVAEIDGQVEAFAAEYASQVNQWSTRFDLYRQQGKRVVLWAAGMRAISLLVNVPAASAGVEFVVDVNPQRQGRYLPRTGQQVVGPEELIALKPDVVVATNPNYAREISAQMQELDVRSEFEILH
jgi:branched-chain amino acid aminotransferase